MALIFYKTIDAVDNGFTILLAQACKSLFILSSLFLSHFCMSHFACPLLPRSTQAQA